MLAHIRTANPAARKSHGCSNCGRLIRRGEQYERQTLSGDDGLYTWKSCSQCVLLYEWIYANDEWAVSIAHDEGLDLAEWLFEYATERGLEGILAAYQNRWLDYDPSALAEALSFIEQAAEIVGDR